MAENMLLGAANQIIGTRILLTFWHTKGLILGFSKDSSLSRSTNHIHCLGSFIREYTSISAVMLYNG
jgi:hypothetical protein